MTQQGTGSAVVVSEPTAAEDTGGGPGTGVELPPVPDDIREAGRLAPDHWLGVVDPMWSGQERPPQWAVLGRWRSGLDGEIVEWEENPDYRPSPLALGWPEPEDEVDHAVQLASTGYGPGEAVPAALVGREVAVLTGPDGGPLSAATPEGTPVVPVFTSPAFLHTAGRLAFELVGVADLVPRIPEGHALYLNPSAAVSMLLDVDAVRDAIRSGAEDGANVREPSKEQRDGVRQRPARVLTEAVHPARGTDA
ncbi:type VII secretion system-associated protein [Streptomyces sp. NPDC058632]|uniref:type VII secretion system-associated protein n=1 Tax=Streptomyces sp. NPDC058632 TaxID=3346567 RepID=UPI003662A8B3